MPGFGKTLVDDHSFQTIAHTFTNLKCVQRELKSLIYLSSDLGDVLESFQHKRKISRVFFYHISFLGHNFFVAVLTKILVIFVQNFRLEVVLECSTQIFQSLNFETDGRKLLLPTGFVAAIFTFNYGELLPVENLLNKIPTFSLGFNDHILDSV